MAKLFNRRKKREANLLKEQTFGSSLISYIQPRSIHAEQFRTLRTNIEFAQVDRQIKSLLVTSSIPAEGKSTVMANLAIVMGQTDKKVLLVDADLRKPRVHRTFNLNNTQGLSTLISNNNVEFNQVIQRSHELNLYFLPSGPVPPNPAELLGSARMGELIKELENYFDLILFDAPPVTAVTDAQILATRVDGVLFVTRYGYVRKDEVREAKKILDNVNANILGYVMNEQPLSENGGYYRYYGYGEDADDGDDE